MKWGRSGPNLIRIKGLLGSIIQYKISQYRKTFVQKASSCNIIPKSYCYFIKKLEKQPKVSKRKAKS